ncbi:MAG: kelch repeat-containing protein, partial [Planctomycetota bacterium]
MRIAAALATAVLMSGTALRPARAGEAAVNRWVRVGDAEIGPRSNYGMVWSAKLKRFVIWGGGIGLYPKGGPFPFDVLSAAPGTSQWRNEFPEGKNWGPEVGKCDPPVWAGYRFSMTDKDGNCRPHMRHAYAYSQYCVDAKGEGMWAILQNHTVRYDFGKRTWEDFGNEAGPGVGTDGTLKWGALCYDPVNKEVVQFGGAHGSAQLEGGTTWLYSPAQKIWRKLESQVRPLEDLGVKVEKLRLDVKSLAAALRNRFCRSELSANARTDLRKMAAGFAAGIEALQAEVRKKEAGVEGLQMKAQLKACMTDLQKAADQVAALGEVSVPGIKAAGAAERTLLRARDALADQPPPRLLAPMVYDAKAKKIVMFGGDRWDHLCAETWVYDPEAKCWSRRRPASSPSPRAGHALLYLPKSGKVVLVGGYTYTSSMSYCAGLYKPLTAEVWCYDTMGGEWSPLSVGGGPVFNSGARAAVVAVSDDDLVTAIEPGHRRKKPAVWTFRPDPSAPAAAQGVKPGATVRRGLCFDPEWFDEAPDAGADAIEAKLKGLPANKWVSMNPPKLLQDRCWGTQVF